MDAVTPEPSDGRVRIGSVVIECRSLHTMVEFWSAALGYQPNEAGRSSDWCRLDHPNGGVNLSFQELPDPAPPTRKLHLDLYSSDQRGEVERLSRLGARVTRWPDPGDDFVVMADPEGNLFCVVAKANRGSGSPGSTA